MSFDGYLTDFSLEEIMMFLGESRKTGTLSVEGESETIWIYFKEGRAVFATPSHLREQLGEVLLQDGEITREDLTVALRTQRRMLEEGNPVRLGTILVAMEAIDRATLERKIKAQILESIFAAMGERAGRFRYFPQLDLADEDILVSLEVKELLGEGAPRIEEWSRIKETIRSYGEVYAANPDRASDADVNFTPHEWRIFRLLNGGRDISAVAEETGFSRFEVCRNIYALLRLNLIRRVSPARVEAARPHATPA